MAATVEVSRLPNERCPDCGSRFARDLKNIGYRRHLDRLPKRDSRGNVRRDATGAVIFCGGTAQSWNKGHRD
jgi:hypothetical protein